MRRASLPRNMNRRPKSASSAVTETKRSAFLIWPDGAPRKTFLPWRKNRPARKMMTTKMKAGSSLTPLV